MTGGACKALRQRFATAGRFSLTRLERGRKIAQPAPGEGAQAAISAIGAELGCAPILLRAPESLLN